MSVSAGLRKIKEQPAIACPSRRDGSTIRKSVTPLTGNHHTTISVMLDPIATPAAEWIHAGSNRLINAPDVSGARVNSR